MKSLYHRKHTCLKASIGEHGAEVDPFVGWFLYYPGSKPVPASVVRRARGAWYANLVEIEPPIDTLKRIRNQAIQSLIEVGWSD